MKPALGKLAAIAAAVTLLLAAGPRPAFADTMNADAEYTACSAKANSTIDMEDCLKGLYARVDTKLNAAYRKAMASLGTEQRGKLQASESTWIKWRDADCNVFYGAGTGTIVGIQSGRCMVTREQHRIDDLSDFFPLGN